MRAVIVTAKTGVDGCAYWTAKVHGIRAKRYERGYNVQGCDDADRVANEYLEFLDWGYAVNHRATLNEDSYVYIPEKVNRMGLVEEHLETGGVLGLRKGRSDAEIILSEGERHE